MNNSATELDCYELQWSKGCPSEPGVYLLRIPKGHDLTELALLMKLCEPEGYDWFVVTMVRNESAGWLEYESPRDGEVRVARTDVPYLHVSYAKLEPETADV